jgi:hypothetical protein
MEPEFNLQNSVLNKTGQWITPKNTIVVFSAISIVSLTGILMNKSINKL